MKKQILFFLLLAMTFNLFAAPVNEVQALRLAKDFIGIRMYAKSAAVAGSSAADLQLTYTGTLSVDDNKITTESKPLYYVFNRGNNQGFIIVSADTRATSILAYSNTGRFDAENIPVNLKSWLHVYETEISYAIDNLAEDTSTSSPVSMQKTSAATTAVAPLLGTINYDQDAPFNLLCPKVNADTTVTGCVATAMAQVMRYYKWPLTGKGTRSYTTATHSFPISVNFATQNFDWDNMTPYYTSNSTVVQKSAVALLMYNIGASVKMDFKTSKEGGSGAYTSNVPTALLDYFNYDAGVQIYTRDFYSITSWKALLKKELDAGRPVIYAGNSATAGHAFVCDGYDDSGKFHFNWGWSGSSNGYYETSALNPGVQGIGSSNGGYNMDQQIITGIQKPVAGSVKSQLMGMTGNLALLTDSIARTGSVDITFMKLFNIGAFDFIPTFGLALYQNGTIKNIIYQYTYDKSLNPGYGWSAFPATVANFSAVANGVYQLIPVYKNENGEMVPILTGNNTISKYDVTITDVYIKFNWQSNKSVLELVSSPVTLGNIYKNKIGQFEVNIKNTSQVEYYAQIGIKLVSADNTLSKEIINSLVNIGVGETKTIQLADSVNLVPGSYKVYVTYDAANQSDVTTFPTTVMGPSNFVSTVDVLQTPTDLPSLNIVTNSVNMPATVYIGHDFTMTASVANSGGVFQNKIVAFIFPMSGPSVGYYGYQSVIIDKNDSKLVSFTGNIFDLAEGNYRTAIFYYDNTVTPATWKQLSSVSYFTLAMPTGVNDLTGSNKLLILSNPVHDILRVSLPDAAKNLSVYDLNGKITKSVTLNNESSVEIPVSDMQKGIYIIRVQTAEGIITGKMIKN